MPISSPFLIKYRMFSSTSTDVCEPHSTYFPFLLALRGWPRSPPPATSAVPLPSAPNCTTAGSTPALSITSTGTSHALERNHSVVALFSAATRRPSGNPAVAPVVSHCKLKVRAYVACCAPSRPHLAMCSESPRWHGHSGVCIGTLSGRTPLSFTHPVFSSWCTTVATYSSSARTSTVPSGTAAGM